MFQASILYLFNEYDTLTCAEIMEKCVMQSEQFNAAMMMLCNPKIMVLKKEIKKPVFAPTEKITINDGFKNNSVQVNLVPTRTHKKKTT